MFFINKPKNATYASLYNKNFNKFATKNLLFILVSSIIIFHI